MERLNIWGKLGCELPNGKLCHACCDLMTINFGFDAGPYKAGRSPCPYQNSVLNGGEGCSCQDNKPANCKLYFCGSEDNVIKADLIAKGLALGLVTEEEAISTAGKILKPHEIERLIISEAKQFKNDPNTPQDFIFSGA